MDLAPSPDWDHAARYSEAHARVRAAEAACGRAGAGVRILVATKSFGVEAVLAACAGGVRLVGENRMQELALKGPAFVEAGAEIHVIGPLQRNKAETAVRWAQCVQTVVSLALAERLSRLCLKASRAMDVMVQVNVSGEGSKHGVVPGEAYALAAAVAALPALTVTGFMTVGLNSPDEATVRAGYARLREIRDDAVVRAERGENSALAHAWELSMGMSGDLEWAIAEGATIVRLGTAVMGERGPGSDTGASQCQS
ncbi:MAG: YggS family pyridoxal phosphate-dependent enzyme [Demequinaceae bacterium]|nr:YggS family pyridoxal phosphate-dependent enzyme [Demequinaceae bacterium]